MRKNRVPIVGWVQCNSGTDASVFYLITSPLPNYCEKLNIIKFRKKGLSVPKTDAKLKNNQGTNRANNSISAYEVTASAARSQPTRQLTQGCNLFRAKLAKCGQTSPPPSNLPQCSVCSVSKE